MTMLWSNSDAPEWDVLVDAAWIAWENAYAPYSGFRVGAAICLNNGSVVLGCNVENASYPLTLCAELTALGAAVAQTAIRPGQITAIVVVTEAVELTPPCGACRQALAEFAVTLPILLVNRYKRKLYDLSDLLPEAFTGKNLGV